MADLTAGVCLIPPSFYRLSQISWSGSPVPRLQSVHYRKPWVHNYSGAYKVAGSTIAGAQPYRALVVLYPQNQPSLCIAGVYTDTVTGTFTFNYLAPGNYMVVAIDVTGTYNNVTYDFVAAVAM